MAIIDFGDLNQCEGWAAYYEDLVNPVDKPKYNDHYKVSMESTFLLLQHQELQSSIQLEELTIPPQVLKHVKGLKNSRRSAGGHSWTH